MPKIYSYFGDFIRLWPVVTLWSLHLPNGIRRRPIHFIPLFNIIQTPK